MNLRAILFVLAILSLVTAGAGGFFLNLHLTSTAWEVAREHTDWTASSFRKQITFYLEQHRRVSIALSGMPQLASALRRTDEAALGDASALLDHQCTSLEASVCYLMDAGGTTVASSNRNTPVSFVGKNYGFRPYFKEAIVGEPAVYLALGVTSKKRGLYFSAPVITSPGEFGGVVVVKFSIDELESELSTLSGIFALTDPKGIVFAANRKSWIFRSLSTLSDKDAETIVKSRQFGEEKPSSVGLIETKDSRVIAPNGKNYLMSKQALYIPAGWHITYLFDTADISSQFKFRVGRLPGESVFVALFLFITCIVFFLYRKATGDIEMRNQAEDALRESEERLRGAIESLQEGFALFDADDRLVAVNDVYRAVNPRAQEFLDKGMRFEDLIRANVAKGRMVEAHGREEEFITERVQQHRNPKDPILRQFNDGKWYLLKETCTPEGGIALTFTNITELKNAEEDRRLALMEAEQANQAKSEFLATMSHDLRTPLNAILGFADILSHQYFGPIGEKYHEYAEDIHSSGELLLSLVNDILDLSIIESGKQSFSKESISAADVVTESERIIKERAQSLGIDLVTKVPKDLPPLFADRRAIMQILLNLLSNSIKFTPEGGKITVRAAATNEHHTIEVSDTGRGIPADRIATITNPFVRTESDPHKTQEGTGLGLTIVKSLVDLHDGELDIKSTVGKGTTVTVTLPNGA